MLESQVFQGTFDQKEGQGQYCLLGGKPASIRFKRLALPSDSPAASRPSTYLVLDMYFVNL